MLRVVGTPKHRPRRAPAPRRKPNQPTRSPKAANAIEMKTVPSSKAKPCRRAHRRAARPPAHHWSMNLDGRHAPAARRGGEHHTCAVGSEGRRCRCAQKDRERSPHHTHRAPTIAQTFVDGNCSQAVAIDRSTSAPPDKAAPCRRPGPPHRGHRHPPTLADRPRSGEREKSAILGRSQPSSRKVATVVRSARLSK